MSLDLRASSSEKPQIERDDGDPIYIGDEAIIIPGWSVWNANVGFDRPEEGGRPMKSGLEVHSGGYPHQMVFEHSIELGAVDPTDKSRDCDFTYYKPTDADYVERSKWLFPISVDEYRLTVKLNSDLSLKWGEPLSLDGSRHNQLAHDTTAGTNQIFLMLGLQKSDANIPEILSHKDAYTADVLIQPRHRLLLDPSLSMSSSHDPEIESPDTTADSLATDGVVSVNSPPDHTTVSSGCTRLVGPKVAARTSGGPWVAFAKPEGTDD